MRQDRAKIAAIIAIAYVVVILSGIILNFIKTGQLYTLKYSLLLPATWLAIIISSVTAWGLWQHFRWAWWFGFSASLIQLARMALWLQSQQELNISPSFSVILALFVVALFFVITAFGGVRNLCVR